MTVVGEASVVLSTSQGDQEEAFTSVVTAPDANHVTPDDEGDVPVWRQLPSDRPGVELHTPGTQVNPPKACEHLAKDVMVEAIVAYVEGGVLDGVTHAPRWDVRLKAICQCGIDFAVEKEGRPPRDGSPGTVLSMRPFGTPAAYDPPDQGDTAHAG